MFKAIERKQAGRWADWMEDKPTPLTDKAWRALGLPTVDKAGLQLLRAAILTDTHLQRPGSQNDLPVTKAAYISAFQELYIRYFDDRPFLKVGHKPSARKETHG